METIQQREVNRPKWNSAIGYDAVGRCLAYLQTTDPQARPSKKNAIQRANIIMSNGDTVDVKCKKSFSVELTNSHGDPGWIFNGADIIMQTFYGSDTEDANKAYIYHRRDMVDYINNHPALFQRKYCKSLSDGSVLFMLYKKTIEKMPFIKCVDLV